MNIDQLKLAIKQVLDEGVWPVYKTDDDNGLEEEEYVQFVSEVLNKMAKLNAQTLAN